MSRALAALAALVLVSAGALGGCGTAAKDEPATRDTSCTASASEEGCATPPSSEADAPPSPKKPLAGRVIVLDPGHQLGNRRFRTEIDERVDAGGFTKACNTTGTATDDGYPEATLTWQVAQLVRRTLVRRGARVLMTRDRNDDDSWGPCVDERGSLGNPGSRGPTADLRLSIHADGSYADAEHGFHVIRPGDLTGWTDDIARPSQRFARIVRDRLVAAGFAISTYRGRAGIDERTDLGTLNHSDVPAVMVELGNMRDADDAAVMTSRAGRQRYARALALAVVQTLGR